MRSVEKPLELHRSSTCIYFSGSPVQSCIYFVGLKNYFCLQLKLQFLDGFNIFYLCFFSSFSTFLSIGVQS